MAVKVALLGSLVAHFRIILNKTLDALDIDVRMMIVL
jgi:hypothetical protein